MLVASLVGARPQFVKLGPIAHAMQDRGVDHKIIHTGQHYDPDMSDAFFRDLGIPDPDEHLEVGSAPHAVQTGAILSRLDPVLDNMAPDWLLVYGDTNSTLAGALAAVKKHIPLAHLEAGLRSGNRRMPEEHNRVLTDHAADLCLAPTDAAMVNLVKENIGHRSRLVGDVMADVCFATRDRVLNKPVRIDDLAPDEPFVLATIHRAENTDDPERLTTLVTRLAQLPTTVVLAVHPRLARIAAEIGLDLRQGALHPVSPLTYPGVVSAVMQSQGVVTDSGGLQKEAYLLERVCTTLRTETEWPETLVSGWNVLSSSAADLSDLAARSRPSCATSPVYGDGMAALRAVGELLDAADPHTRVGSFGVGKP